MEQTNSLNAGLARKCDRLHTISYRPATARLFGALVVYWLFEARDELIDGYSGQRLDLDAAPR
jgi:hypothetical protein